MSAIPDSSEVRLLGKARNLFEGALRVLPDVQDDARRDLQETGKKFLEQGIARLLELSRKKVDRWGDASDAELSALATRSRAVDPVALLDRLADAGPEAIRAAARFVGDKEGQAADLIRAAARLLPPPDTTARALERLADAIASQPAPVVNVPAPMVQLPAPAPALPPAVTQVVEYDNKGRIQAVVRATIPADGGPAVVDRRVCHYDAAGRLLRVEPDTPTTPGTP